MTDENTVQDRKPHPEKDGGSSKPLSDEQAIDSLMGISSESDPEGTPEEEVTKDVSASEAAVREPQSRAENAQTEDNPAEQLLESEEDTEESEEEAEAEPEEEADPQEETAESDEEDEDTDPDDAVLFHLEDGTPVSVNEAKRGFLRQEDYSRKTQELAQQRQQLQESFKAREGERQVVAENLNMALSVVEPQLADLAKTDWNHLAQTDPQEYAERSALFHQAQARYNELQQRSQALVQQVQQQQQQQKQMHLREEAQKLRQLMPDFADPKSGPKLRSAIAEYAREIGLSKEEATAISDHRLIMVLDKARRYDDLRKGKIEAGKKKVKSAPKKPLPSGTPTTTDQRKARATKEKLANLQRSGSVDDALAYLMS